VLPVIEIILPNNENSRAIRTLKCKKTIKSIPVALLYVGKIESKLEEIPLNT
jgi:hypothetical protein